MKFFNQGEIWEIGPFQLENLLMNEGNFLYLNLSKNVSFDSNLEKEALALLSTSKYIKLEDLEKVVSNELPYLEHPVVLVCEKGQRSRQAARRLAKLKYTNVYVLSGGIKALTEYFAPSK